ncbi:hypothetical protein SUGI_0814230 [Cryptomeria japonica]|uniref:protein argonaute 7 n=1 Tax=Cryptomeria japonica TaxID=3369 RepID=UPI0024148E2D|nr:protein argonaute 7 [Cryptomeria japonica]GLJ39829.1 hypothetical protein SUGI_0814230 [Cryptomeria japonica]
MDSECQQQLYRIVEAEDRPTEKNVEEIIQPATENFSGKQGLITQHQLQISSGLAESLNSIKEDSEKGKGNQFRIEEKFPQKICVIDYLRENCSLICKDCDRFSDEDREKAEKKLKGLKVRVTHRRCAQKYTVNGLTNEMTRDLKFEVTESSGLKKDIGIIDYFVHVKKYTSAIRYQFLPCLDLVLKPGDESIYVPIEFCEILAKDNLNLQRIEFPTAEEMGHTILDTIRKDDGVKVNQFQIAMIKNKRSIVSAAVHRPPQLKLGSEKEITPVQKKGQYNLLNRRVYDSKAIDNKWGLLFFSNDPQPPPQWPSTIIQKFMSSLAKICTEIGMKMAEEPQLCQYQSMECFSDLAKLRLTLKNLHKKGLEILVCVMEAEKCPGYKTLKLVAETEIGLITQCCLLANVNKYCDLSCKQSPQYLANLALKINAKLGGIKAVLEQSPFGNSKVFIFGGDVKFPSSNDNSPSVAALVGSINNPACNRYLTRIRYQDSAEQHINQLADMAKDLIDEYRDINRGLPEKIIFFRQGISDYQLKRAVNKEIAALKQAVSKYEGKYEPRISFIVAQKSRRTRLEVAEEHNTYKWRSVPPGTVVENSPNSNCKQLNFLMCSHNGQSEKSRPTYYRLVYDENEFTLAQLQMFINDLCYTCVRSKEPLSLPPPLYYAHLAAYRGKHYAEASSSFALNLPKIPKLIHNNSMFFC